MTQSRHVPGNDREEQTPSPEELELDPAGEGFGLDLENDEEPEEVFLDESGQPIQQGPPKAKPEEEGVRDRLLRLMADFENFRRRSIKERAEERQRGRRDAAERLLPVYDSLAMGLLSLKPDDPARPGLEAVQRQLLTAFEQLGIRKVAAKGNPFDPELHEAIAKVPNEQFEEGVVCEESRAGFEDDLGLLRPAQVLVSSGPAG